ncbi:hemerythrin domain-containing protein [Luteimonas sp. e5]
MPRLGPLLELAREHHGALLLARDARRVDPADAEARAAMNRRIAAYWEQEMAAHFRHEEALLQRFADALEAPLRERLLADHAVLQAMSQRAAHGTLDAASLNAFGERLAAHVRFEERECFDALQAAWAAQAQLRK